jgi:hypothetical protein
MLDRLPPTPTELAVAAEGLLRRSLADGWAGPDPYDALWGEHWPRVLVDGPRRRQALIQLHARAPVNVRVLHRRRNPVIAKALAVFGLAACRLHRLRGNAHTRKAALEPLRLLCADESAGADAWGYPFPVQTRWSYYAARTPNIVVTSFAIAALSEAAETFGIDEFAVRARRAATWVLDALFIEEHGIFVYHPGSDALIHNANLLGARAVRQAGLDSPAAQRAIERALSTTLEAQNLDGSWPYGQGPGLSFVDSFHTGFVLDCLVTLGQKVPGTATALKSGARFYVDRFFGSAGEARLWPDRRFPEDAHSAGTGLTAIAALANAGLVSPKVGAAPASRILRTVLQGDRCICRRYRWGATHVRYPRWCDAHVALGLASYALVV